MPWRRFLASNTLGAVLWVGVWVTLGDLAGDHIGTVYPAIQRYELYLLAAAGVALAVVAARHLLHRRATYATEPSPGPDDQETPVP